MNTVLDPPSWLLEVIGWIPVLGSIYSFPVAVAVIPVLYHLLLLLELIAWIPVLSLLS